MQSKNKRRPFYRKEIELYKSIFMFFIFAGLGVAALTIFYTIFATNIVTLIIDKYELERATGSAAVMTQMLTNRWFYIVLGGFLLLAMATFFTHRFAGPLYRFETSLDRMTNRDFSFEVKLRKNDECVSMADKFNQCNKRLSSTFRAMKFLVDEIDKNHVKLRRGSMAEEAALMEAMDLNQRLKKMLSGFKCD